MLVEDKNQVSRFIKSALYRLQSSRKKQMFLCVFLTEFLIISASVLYLAAPGEKEGGRIGASALLLLPAVQILVIQTVRKKIVKNLFSIFMSLSLLICTVFWIFYTFQTFFKSEILMRGLSWLAVIASIVILSCCLIIVFIMLCVRRGQDEAVLAATQMELRDHSFLSLCFFLTIFLCISYMFCFAFAFHDRSRILDGKSPGLYSPLQLYSSSEPRSSNIRKNLSTSDQKPTHRNQDRIDQGHMDSSVSHEAKLFILFFKESQAKLEFDEEILSNPSKVSDNEELRRMIKNTSTLTAIVKSIHDFQREDPYGRIELKLVGHSSDTQIGENRSRYKSNFELSAARTQNVWAVIEEELREDNNEWYNIYVRPLPKTNEPDFLLPIQELRKYTQNSGLRSDLSVEVAIRAIPEDPARKRSRDKSAYEFPKKMLDSIRLHDEDMKKRTPRKLTLLDYIYFTIYTITTTGYGDIVPISDEAKFISSLANLFELFFIVIFFNVLLAAFLGNRREPADSQVTDAIEAFSHNLHNQLESVKKSLLGRQRNQGIRGVKERIEREMDQIMGKLGEIERKFKEHSGPPGAEGEHTD